MSQTELTITKKVSPELQKYIDKLATGIDFTINRSWYFQRIEQLGKQDGFSDYELGILIREALKARGLGERSVRRYLPDKYKEQNMVREQTSKSKFADKFDANEGNNVQEESCNIPASKETIMEAQQAVEATNASIANPSTGDILTVKDERAQAMQSRCIRINGAKWNRLINAYTLGRSDWYLVKGT